MARGPYTACALCGSNEPLCNSHIIPKFVGRWLKETSATGYLRKVGKPNVRREDLITEKLLCSSCEQMFGKLEDRFKREIFDPYVSEELDSMGVGTGLRDAFHYDEFLLRTCISLQWRALTDNSINDDKRLSPWHLKKLSEMKLIFSDYLLGVRNDTGKSESHLVFFQNILGAFGSLPSHVHDDANYYVMRVVDSTVVWGPDILGIFTKLGPMCFYTSLYPTKMNRMVGTRIRKKGSLPTVQKLFNTDFTHFVYSVRPREMNAVFPVSEKQHKVINETAEADLEKLRNSLSFAAVLGREQLRALKNERTDWNELD